MSILPIILPSLVGVGLFGFTLSWDEIARSSQVMGEHNTLPMELQGLTTTVTTPEIYALGTATTGVSFAVIAVALFSIGALARGSRAMGRTPAKRERNPRGAGYSRRTSSDELPGTAGWVPPRRAIAWSQEPNFRP